MIALRVTPSRMSSVTGGVERDAVADDEEVRRRRLVDVAVGGQHDRLVEAVELGLGLLEGHVHVAADDLAAGRQRLVRVAPPGRGHDPAARFGVDVVAERHGDDVQLVLEVMEPDADRAGRLVERRPDVGVLVERRCGGPSRRSGRSARRPTARSPSSGSGTTGGCARRARAILSPYSRFWSAFQYARMPSKVAVPYMNAWVMMLTFASRIGTQSPSK